MRLKDILIREDHLPYSTEEEDKPFIIVYSKGKTKMSYLPDHGETKIITHQGEVKRVRFDEGEEFK
ncbi:XtrA/YqaO family protein [Oceanobacillus kimchii]|uniref:Uncharacterized protein n=1 Tax=Oceanobacillus kimchii TaxID=746691 RepID=A0ABQ5TCS5_9BACI|nr:XtrA/YqaO family protein [Oceanobacillus kimchii]GLO64398.1 hypothetical protein MACH08_01820 [Oceanobacillus kimchii]